MPEQIAQNVAAATLDVHATTNCSEIDAIAPGPKKPGH